MFGAVQRNLWLRICRATCFPRSFMHGLLDSDIVDEVPQKPSLQWFQNAWHDLLHEEKHWSQVVQNRQRRAAKIFGDEDWAAGGRWHASKLKPPAAATLISLGQTTALHVSPLRTSKQSHAVFRLLSPCSVKFGDVWQIADIAVRLRPRLGSMLRWTPTSKQV